MTKEVKMYPISTVLTLSLNLDRRQAGNASELAGTTTVYCLDLKIFLYRVSIQNILFYI